MSPIDATSRIDLQIMIAIVNHEWRYREILNGGLHSVCFRERLKRRLVAVSFHIIGGAFYGYGQTSDQRPCPKEAEREPLGTPQYGKKWIQIVVCVCGVMLEGEGHDQQNATDTHTRPDEWPRAGRGPIRSAAHRELMWFARASASSDTTAHRER
jgi:hypothetical protein